VRLQQIARRASGVPDNMASPSSPAAMAASSSRHDAARPPAIDGGLPWRGSTAARYPALNPRRLGPGQGCLPWAMAPPSRQPPSLLAADPAVTTHREEGGARTSEESAARRGAGGRGSSTSSSIHKDHNLRVQAAGAARAPAPGAAPPQQRARH
jgi:hypothetical protein